MKTLIFLSFVAVATAATIRDGDILDIFNMDKILERRDLRREVFGCLMGRGTCEEYLLIKERGPNIVKTGCADCTLEQKAKFQNLLKKIADRHKKEFKVLVDKFHLPIDN